MKCLAKKKNGVASAHVCRRKKGHKGKHRCGVITLSNYCGIEWANKLAKKHK